MIDKFYDMLTTTRILDRSPTTVYRLVKAGRLTVHYRPADPRNPLFKRSEVEALVVPQPQPGSGR
jgi:hypothetical protein